MENTFNIQDVIDASRIITAGSAPKSDIKKAEKFLLAFQKSPQAWSLTYDILKLDGLETKVYAQVSILLKQKLQYDFYQVQENDYVTIMKAILELLMKFSHSSIISSLCFSFILLYMRTFETMGDLIDILKETLFKEEGKETVALVVLTFAAEVTQNEDIVIEKEKSDRYMNYLVGTLKPNVFGLLDTIGKNENLNSECVNQLLDTFHEWVFICRSDDDLLKEISKHSCFTLALNLLSKSEHAEYCRFCLNETMKAIKKPEDNPAVFEAVFENIMNYIQQCQAILNNESEQEHVLIYVKVFRCFGKKFSEKMITSQNPDLLKFLEFLVELTSNVKLDLRVYEELEDFWKEFFLDFDVLTKNGKNPQLIQDFQLVFFTLISIVINRMQISPDQLQFIEKLGSKAQEEKDKDDEDEEEEREALENDLADMEEKQNERKICRSLLHRVQKIIGFQETFDAILKELGRDLQSKKENFGPDEIAKLECILYSAKSCIIDIKRKEEPDLNPFFQIVMSLNVDCIKYNRTKIQLIRTASRKINLNEDLISQMFEFLAANINNPVLTEELGQALVTICGNWNEFVIKHFDNFLQLREKFHDVNYLLMALASAISYADHSESRENYLLQLCKPFAVRIQECIQKSNSDTDKQIIEEIINNLKKFGIIIENMPKDDDQAYDKIVHPLIPIFEELWPTLSDLFEKYYNNDFVIEYLSKVIKKTLKAIGSKFKQFMIPFMEIMCQIYMRSPNNDLLYNFEMCVCKLGRDPDLLQIFTKAYDIICEATLNFFDTRELGEHIDLLSDFFGLLFRYTKHIPAVLLSSKTLEINLHLAEMTIGTDSPKVQETLFFFLEYLFKLCSLHPENEVQKVISEIMINKYGAIYIHKLILELVEYPNSKLRTYLLDTILASFLAMKDPTVTWIGASLEVVPETILTIAEKHEMLKSLADVDEDAIRENLSKRKKEDDERDIEELKKREMQHEFERIFEFFENRCQLNANRDFNLEKPDDVE